IGQLKNDLGEREINFVIGRLSDFDMDNMRFPHWTMVREAQVTVAEADPHGTPPVSFHPNVYVHSYLEASQFAEKIVADQAV
ncbi:MAG: hypothetical protein AB8B55_01655, partial [Mariniblastus sp.]